MEELDLLKKSWNKKENFPEVTEEKIYGMLHKNSSSTIKWIFLISIIEFLFGLLLNVGMQFTKSHEDTIDLLKKAGVFTFYQIGSGIIWVVALYFIYRFYTIYKKVSTTDSVKKLMETIINARKTVRNYIIFNLSAGAVFLFTVYSFVLNQMLESISIEQHKEITTGFYLGAFAAMIIVTAVFIGLFWLFYRLIYGFLLKRLKKNYNELEKIDY
ncbi:hypothetical protein NAT51_11735 [Flavobacterium amniphilum]|uniref:hypothetical protein n=1 Tax=Flavobacterium amniphilum TaxID=1834035 RepID=UPI00202A081B|nr:hypothetical protein [Flavobacterium amniphilum]MCL9806197.1 hypothetical protein [Flavobacterium amniphilum]